ncbi:unnamed protein product [Coffea canephora]|uniref:DH200=94 genomic scaffold, scaffold_840 n=1 Tax=Coffea canephora TaxID=49390 RepID=A0A068VHG4_COFCA|nr:unnamed protein product [Coffea canephora]
MSKPQSLFQGYFWQRGYDAHFGNFRKKGRTEGFFLLLVSRRNKKGEKDQNGGWLLCLVLRVFG